MPSPQPVCVSASEGGGGGATRVALTRATPTSERLSAPGEGKGWELSAGELSGACCYGIQEVSCHTDVRTFECTWRDKGTRDVSAGELSGACCCGLIEDVSCHTDVGTFERTWEG
jgi:hypothetical protein